MSRLQRTVKDYALSGTPYDRWKMLIAMQDHMTETVKRASQRRADSLSQLDAIFGATPLDRP